MTDPVDTDALRDVAASRLTPQHHVAVITAAADDVDRLRAELDSWDPAWRHMRDQRDSLRAVIENAPHYIDADGWWCRADTGDACTCWKADAL